MIQQWLQHVQHTCPSSFYLPQFDAADILGVVGYARGAPNQRTRALILASAMRRQMTDLALHELSWEDIMAVLLQAEPLVLRFVVDDRATAAEAAAQSKKRSRDDRAFSSTLPVLLHPNPFQFRLLALAISRFRRRLSTCTSVAPDSTDGGPGRVLPALISITWYNPHRSHFHAHMCALSIERSAAASATAAAPAAETCSNTGASATSDIDDPDGLVAILYDPIPRGKQAQKAEHARSEIVTMLQRVLGEQCGGIRLLLSGAVQPQKVDPTKSPLCAPFSLLFLHARALGLSDADYRRVFVELKQREGLGMSVPIASFT